MVKKLIEDLEKIRKENKLISLNVELNEGTLSQEEIYYLTDNYEKVFVKPGGKYWNRFYLIRSFFSNIVLQVNYERRGKDRRKSRS
jgi:hypothetical protein